ncbi:MAG: hypothetical protein ACM359_03005 [Bacillota bacterium]
MSGLSGPEAETLWLQSIEVAVVFSIMRENDDAPLLNEQKAALVALQATVVKLRSQLRDLDQKSVTLLEGAAHLTDWDEQREADLDPAIFTVLDRHLRPVATMGGLGGIRLDECHHWIDQLDIWCQSAAENVPRARGRLAETSIDEALIQLAVCWHRATGRDPTVSWDDYEQGYRGHFLDFARLVLSKVSDQLPIESRVRKLQGAWKERMNAIVNNGWK